VPFEDLNDLATSTGHAADQAFKLIQGAKPAVGVPNVPLSLRKYQHRSPSKLPFRPWIYLPTWYGRRPRGGLTVGRTEDLRGLAARADAQPPQVLARPAVRGGGRQFGRAAVLDPAEALPHIGLGTAYLDLHSYEKALAGFNTAIEIEPREPLRALQWQLPFETGSRAQRRRPKSRTAWPLKRRWITKRGRPARALPARKEPPDSIVSGLSSSAGLCRFRALRPFWLTFTTVERLRGAGLGS